jgi:hypothetical protein
MSDIFREITNTLKNFGQCIRHLETFPYDSVPGGGVHDLLSISHSDTDPDAVVQGDIIVGNATPEWARLPIGIADTVLTSDGTNATWEAVAPSRQTILTFSGDLEVIDNPLRIYNQLGVTQTISEVFICVNTAPVGANIIVDVHKDGVTIFTNQAHRPEIVAAGYTDSTTDIDVPAWADGSYLTAHIDQIGGATVGADLVVHIIHS